MTGNLSGRWPYLIGGSNRLIADVSSERLMILAIDASPRKHIRAFTTSTNHGEIERLAAQYKPNLSRIAASKDALHRIAGVSRGTVSNAERGVHGVRGIVTKMWALSTGVSLRWIETGVEPGPGDDEETKLPRLDSNQEPAD